MRRRHATISSSSRRSGPVPRLPSVIEHKSCLVWYAWGMQVPTGDVKTHISVLLGKMFYTVTHTRLSQPAIDAPPDRQFDHR